MTLLFTMYFLHFVWCGVSWSSPHFGDSPSESKSQGFFLELPFCNNHIFIAKEVKRPISTSRATGWMHESTMQTPCSLTNYICVCIHQTFTAHAHSDVGVKANSWKWRIISNWGRGCRLGVSGHLFRASFEIKKKKSRYVLVRSLDSSTSLRCLTFLKSFSTCFKGGT